MYSPTTLAERLGHLGRAGAPRARLRPRRAAAASGTVRTTHLTSGSAGGDDAQPVVAQPEEQDRAERLGGHLAADAHRNAGRAPDLEHLVELPHDRRMVRA